MRIREILHPKRIVLDVENGAKRDILTKLAETFEHTHKHLDVPELIEVLVKREETSTTAIADGIAIPHGKLDISNGVLCGFGRSTGGVDFDSVDGCPTHIFFLLVSPANQPSLHLRWLAHLAVLLKNPDFRSALIEADTPEAVLAAVEREENAQEARNAKTEVS